MLVNISMKTIIAALAIGAASASSHAAADGLTAKQTLAYFHEALAKGDSNRALGFLSKDVVIYEAGHIERSRDEYAHHHLKGDMEFAKNTAVKTLRQTEREGKDMVVIWQETETTGTAGNKPVHLLGTATAVLEKRDARWSIVHLHWSSRKPK